MYGLEVVFIRRVGSLIIERTDREVYIEFFKVYLRDEILFVFFLVGILLV